MPEFEIEHYTIKTNMEGSGNRRRFVDLVSPDLSHGIRNRVRLMFYSPYSDTTGSNPFQKHVGQVSNFRPSNFDGMKFVAFVPFNAFEEYYDLLRTESPVYFHYRIVPTDDDSNSRWLSQIGIWTGLEPTGEGFPDLSEFLPDEQ